MNVDCAIANSMAVLNLTYEFCHILRKFDLPVDRVEHVPILSPYIHIAITFSPEYATLTQDPLSGAADA